MPESKLTDLERQDLRHAALHVLATRPRMYLSAGSISVSLSRLLPFRPAPDDIADALQFLVGKGNVESTRDPFGAETLYRITSEGILTNERAENA